MRSWRTTGELWSVARYNSNNAWLYNGNNGKLNNNNLYNALSSRAFDYDIADYENDQVFLDFLYEFYEAYYICRKTKRSKYTQLEFEYNLSRLIIPLAISVYKHEYIPFLSIVFAVLYPQAAREVIAAWFGDRVVQTWYCEKLKPFLEKYHYEDDSYSCRKGKGSLRAVQQLQEYIFEASNGYTEDVYLIKKDVEAFFMSIDPVVLEELLVDFIWQNFEEDEELRNTLCYLTRVLYCSLPQEHCEVKGNELTLRYADQRKSLKGKIIGLPIGNKTSQDAGNFVTSFYLEYLRLLLYLFVHYTDDTAIVVKAKDLQRWKNDSKIVDSFIEDKLHLKWHRKKYYIQPYQNGIIFLGYKLRFDRTLPSNRVVHNFLWKCEIAMKKSVNKRWMFRNIESFMQTFNSYTGILKWCNSYKLRKDVFKKLRKSELRHYYYFYNNEKITIQPSKTKERYFRFLNRQRKLRNKI